MNNIFKLLFTLSAIFLFSCSNSVEKRKNVICLIDYSGTISKEVIDSYSSIISKDIFLNLGQHDKFIVMPIDEGAKTQPVFLAYYDFKNAKFSRHTDGVTHKQDSIKRRLLSFLSTKSDSVNNEIHRQKEVRKSFTNYTDIINALEQLSSKCEKNEIRSEWQKISDGIMGNTVYNSENILIICSDMIHESKEFNFNKQPDISKQELDEILKQLKNANRIPDLIGLTVFVNGRTGRDNDQTDNIKYFWENYFKEAKANLIAYDFDTHHSVVDYLQASK